MKKMFAYAVWYGLIALFGAFLADAISAHLDASQVLFDHLHIYPGIALLGAMFGLALFARLRG